MYKINDQVVQLDVPFTVGEGDEAIQYPANWIRLASKEEKDAIGLVEVIQESRPDDKFYFVTDNGDGTYTSSPRDLTELKTNIIAQLKSLARSELRQTDWYVTRLLDPTDGSEIPQAVMDARKAIKDKVSEQEQLIEAAESVEELASIV